MMNRKAAFTALRPYTLRAASTVAVKISRHNSESEQRGVPSGTVGFFFFIKSSPDAVRLVLYFLFLHARDTRSSAAAVYSVLSERSAAVAPDRSLKRVFGVVLRHGAPDSF